MSDNSSCNCPIIMIALAFLIAATGIAIGAIYGLLAGALAYVGLWLVLLTALFARFAFPTKRDGHMPEIEARDG